MWNREIRKISRFERFCYQASYHFKPTNLPQARWWALVFLCLWTHRAGGQSLSLDLGIYQQRLRDAQLQGLIDSQLSMHVLPLDLERTKVFANDSAFAPSDLLRDLAQMRVYQKEKGLKLTILPVHFRHQYNMHHHYGWQNGPMVPTRGQQMYLSVGVHLRLNKHMSLQIRPEGIWAQNHDIPNPPVRHGGIDNPDRFGTKALEEMFAGQSYLKWHHGPISWGVSTENVQWGPSRNGSLILSNSAPGFLHLTAHTNRPIRTKIGSFEGQFVGGRLRYSGFYPYSIDGVPTATIEPSPFGKREHSKISALTLNYQPRWVPGLFLGGALGIQSVGMASIPGLFAVLLPGNERANNANFSAQNGLFSLQIRYLLTPVQAEFYAEVGRDDWWYDLQDLATDPFHTTVFLLGMNKVKTLSKTDHYLRFGFEFTQLMAPITQISRAPGRSFYTHSNGIGWTHRGQILGVGLPPGSIRHILGASWHKGQHSIGLDLERIEYAQDLFYFRMPFLLNPNIGNPLAMDYTKRFVDLVAKLRVQSGYKGLVAGVEGMLVRTLNYQWIYDTSRPPDPFRFPGFNVWSVNVHSYLYYRF